MADRNDPCFIAIRAITPDDITDEQILNEITRVEGIQANSKSRIDFKRKANEELVRLEREAELEKRDLVRNALVEIAFKTRVAEFSGKKDSITQALFSMFQDQSGNNFNSVFEGNMGDIGAALAPLYKNGGNLWPVAEDPAKMRDIMRQVWNGRSRLPAIDDEIFDVAMVVIDSSEIKRAVQLRSGVNVNFLERRFARQYHDPAKIEAVPEAEWIEDYVKWFGDKSMPDISRSDFRARLPEIREKILSDAYELRESQPKKPGEKFTGSRSLIANDADALYEFNVKYGYDNTAQALMMDMKSVSRHAALVEIFGTNYPTFIKEKLALAQKQIEDSDIGPVGKVAADLERKFVGAMFNTARGLTDIPGRGHLAKAVTNVRSLSVISMLGNTALRSMMDLPGTVSNIRSTVGSGENPLSVYFKAVEGFLAALPQKNRVMIAERTRIYVESLYQEALRDTLIEGQQPGYIVKSMRRFGKLSLVTQQHGAAKQSNILAGRILHEYADLEFDVVTREVPQLKDTFDKYGITKKHWDVMRKTSDELPGIFGRSYRAITPESILDNGDSKTHREAARAVTRFLVDTSIIGSPSSNLASKTLTTWGLKQEDYSGSPAKNLAYNGFVSFLRLIAFLKQTPIAQLRSTANVLRSSRGSDMRGRVNYAARLGEFAAAMLVMGYTIEALLEIVKNRKPPAVNEELVKKIVLRNGPFGIIGDAMNSLGSEYDKTFWDKARSAANVILGPLMGLPNKNMKYGGTIPQGMANAFEALKGAIIAGGTPPNIIRNIFKDGHPYATFLHDYKLGPHVAPIIEQSIKLSGTWGLNTFATKQMFEWGLYRYLHELGNPGSADRALLRETVRPRILDDNLEFDILDWDALKKLNDPTESAIPLPRKP